MNFRVFLVVYCIFAEKALLLSRCEAAGKRLLPDAGQKMDIDTKRIM